MDKEKLENLEVELEHKLEQLETMNGEIHQIELDILNLKNKKTMNKKYWYVCKLCGHVIKHDDMRDEMAHFLQHYTEKIPTTKERSIEMDYAAHDFLKAFFEPIIDDKKNEAFWEEVSKEMQKR